jgi:non-heme chloroperoxidase
MAMQESIEAGVRCVDAFATTDSTGDLREFDIPTLVIPGATLKETRAAPTASP